MPAPLNVNAAFLEWIEQTPQALGKFIEIIKIWYEQSNKGPLQQPSEDGPKEFHADETHELRTVGISDAELDAMYKGFGEAIVKEKALEYVKGFVASVIFAA